MAFACEVLSILDATLTVSPKRVYLGLRSPTTLATTGPELMPCCVRYQNTEKSKESEAKGKKKMKRL